MTYSRHSSEGDLRWAAVRTSLSSSPPSSDTGSHLIAALPPPPEEQRSRAGPGAGAMRWGRPSGAGSDAGGAERSCSPPQPLYPDPDLPPPRPGRPRAPPRRGNFAARPQSSLPAGSRARGEWGRDEEEEKEEEQRVPKKGL